MLRSLLLAAVIVIVSSSISLPANDIRTPNGFDKSDAKKAREGKDAERQREKVRQTRQRQKDEGKKIKRTGSCSFFYHHLSAIFCSFAFCSATRRGEQAAS